MKHNHSSQIAYDSSISELRLLIFKIDGIYMGIDMEQIAEMRSRIDQRDAVYFWLHEKISFQNKEISYRTPVFLLINDEEKSSGIIIDQPEDIDVAVHIDSISPLPIIIETVCKNSPIWGVTIIQEKIILLIDAYRLLRI